MKTVSYLAFNKIGVLYVLPLTLSTNVDILAQPNYLTSLITVFKQNFMIYDLSENGQIDEFSLHFLTIIYERFFTLQKAFGTYYLIYFSRRLALCLLASYLPNSIAHLIAAILIVGSKSAKYEPLRRSQLTYYYNISKKAPFKFLTSSMFGKCKIRKQNYESGQFLINSLCLSGIPNLILSFVTKIAQTLAQIKGISQCERMKFTRSSDVVSYVGQ